MKDKKVLIRITDKHESEEDSFTSELTTVGTLEGSGGDYAIVYTETDEEMADCVTTLRVEGKRKITMTRSGKYTTEMIIEKNRRHSCHYSTPFGELMMGVYAKTVRSEMGEDGGILDFSYTIDFNNALASINELSITVQACKEDDKNVSISQ